MLSSRPDRARLRRARPRLDSVGQAVPRVRLRVMSLATGQPAEPGEPGEIQARAGSLMAGYLPAGATAEAFCDGWYRTGDVGTIDAGGWLRLTGRSKEMIKVRGFQVAPAEVEAVLHGHPAVADCAVFGVPDPADGQAVVAAVTAEPGRDVDPAELRGDERLGAAFAPQRRARHRRGRPGCGGNEPAGAGVTSGHSAGPGVS